MISNGKRSHKSIARPVLPAAVGPIKKTQGGNDDAIEKALTATQEQAIQTLHIQLYPCRSAMVTLG